MFKIVVGVNDRDEALDALRLAREIAAVEGAEVIAAAAFEYYAADVMTLAYPEAQRVFYEAVEKRAESALAGVPYTLTRLTDSPAHGLQHLAEAEKADLIVLGSTHRG
ncbi:MAG TPA: universal stress protein, partial [Solirubrobacterales bacterium]